MEYQNKLAQPYQDSNCADLLNPLNLNEPIEGALISEEEVMRAPVLQVEIMEGN